MEHKKRQRRKSQTSAVVGAVLLIVAVTVIYMMELDRVVSDNIDGTISELSEHDRLNIEDSIESTWEELEHVYGKFQSYGSATVSDVEQLMNVECANSDFNHIYLVAADGKIYTDKMVIYDPAREDLGGRIDLLPYFQQGEERIVTRFDDRVAEAGISRESILYGIRLENYAVGGVQMAGLVGITDIDDVQNRLAISSFVKNGQSRGHSAVIDLDGNYIVNVERSAYLGDQGNFFERVEQGEKSGMDRQTVAQKMQANESFVFSYTGQDGKKEYVYCEPFDSEEIPWYFILVVDNALFAEQNRTFIIMSCAMLVCIILAVAFLLYTIMKSRHETRTANAEANASATFLANMSHEIRTPLNGITGLIYLVSKDIDNKNQRHVVKQRLAKASDTADYLLSLINNVLDISKLQSGEVTMNQDVVSLEAVLDDVYAMQKNHIENQGIEFVVEKEITAPWIISDEVIIKRVLMNIVGNAAKFTPKGGRIRLSLAQRVTDGEHVDTVFTCEDNGCGMSEEFMSHIWDSFSQERNKNMDSTKGTGLGMAISKLLVDAMGGDIQVSSRLNVGSTFVVTFPALVADQKQEHCQDEEADVVSADHPERKLRVLVVEDNDLNAEILLEVLWGEGFDAVRAANGQLALDCFSASSEGEFDAILMDMQMPVMDGCEATRQIRSLKREDAKIIPIIACTANTFKEDRARAYESGMNDFLTKPIDVQDLMQKLNGDGRAKRLA
jgi:signal transduction histidine kinase/ActR/RegA family two-component response regulator